MSAPIPVPHRLQTRTPNCGGCVATWSRSRRLEGGVMALTVDEARMEAFVGRLLDDWKGFFASVMVILGDRLGLFRTLAELGAATSDGLADAARCNERYVREWCNGMVVAGYMTYDPARRRTRWHPKRRGVRR